MNELQFYKLLQNMQSLKEIIARLEGDPYQILQSNTSHTFSEIKKNYRTLALKYHPDRNKDDQAKAMFIKINQAFQFLENQDNRNNYLTHIKNIQEYKQRVQSMDQKRKTMINQLKKREEQYNRTKVDLEKQVLRRKEFYNKKMKEDEQRQHLREEILQSIKPSQYYQEVASIKVNWQKGFTFSKLLLEEAFSEYGNVVNVQIQPKRRTAIVTFNSIQTCSQVVGKFKNSQISVDFLLSRQRRQYLLKGLKKQKNSEIDFSLNTQNLQRLKQILNRKSNLYIDPTSKTA